MPDRRAVLITRPEPDASETAALVAARGFDPVIAPVSVLRTCAITLAGNYNAIITTSRNAIPALPAALKHLPLVAVGNATAARADAAGFSVVLNAGGDALALAALARERLPIGARLLFAHGVGQGDALAAALSASGFAVSRACAYAVTPLRQFPATAQDAMETSRLRSAMFLSAETARSFVRLLPARLVPLLGDIHAVAIGAAAAEVLAPLPWQGVRVSVRPTLDEVLALL